MKRNKLALFAILIPLLCLGAASVYFLPPVRDRVAWRVDEWKLRIGYSMNPPEKQVFQPQGLAQPAVTVVRGAPATLAQPTDTPAPSATPTPVTAPPTEIAASLATATAPATAAATPLPKTMVIEGIQYEDQHGRWNYCAPANLSMALTFWGWDGDRDVVGPALKPVEKDKNVMPYEMADYVMEQTALRVVMRIGGSLDLLKRFIAAGFPVVVEKGTYLRDVSGVVSWMGHYQVVTGYDDGAAEFVTQDSFIKADHPVSYEEMVKSWRAFNYTYLVVYPAEREPEVMALLGPDADERVNAENAALLASNEVYGLSGIDQYFAWFNRGSSLVKLEDYGGASMAYDEAFTVYPSIPESERPWRMMWYQTGPYYAYFYAQRYYDVLNLSHGTLEAMQGDKNLEESYYWRGMARDALGDTQAAIEDFQQALGYHPGFGPAVYQLQRLGVQ